MTQIVHIHCSELSIIHTYVYHFYTKKSQSCVHYTIYGIEHWTICLKVFSIAEKKTDLEPEQYPFGISSYVVLVLTEDAPASTLFVIFTLDGLLVCNVM